MTTFINITSKIRIIRLSKKLIQNIGDKALIEHMIICAKKINNALLMYQQILKIIQKYADKHNVKSLYRKKI
jgi:hypothetical protein